jgi:sugar phosphate isomerase/epimerase
MVEGVKKMRLGLEAGAETLDLAVELGIKGVPVGINKILNDGVEVTMKPLHERGLQACQIGAFAYNPLSPDPEEKAKQTAMLEQLIPLAPEVGCNYIVICGGNYHPSSFGAGDVRNFTDQALDDAASALKPLLVLAEQAGVCLSIEPYIKAAINSPERFLALRERVNSNALRINIDPTSLYDYWDLWNSDDKVTEVCTKLTGHYGLGHIKEVAFSEGFHIHAGLAPLGQGVTNWAKMLKLMAPHLPEDSWVILEHVMSAEEGRNSYQLLQDAAASVNVTLE